MSRTRMRGASTRAKARLLAVTLAVVTGGVLAGGAPGALANTYTPSGTIVADSGLRPESGGYAFENYTNEGNPQNLGAPEMQKLFGPGVCVGGNAEDCALKPAAKAWADKQNGSMGGGHCEGFAVTASLFHAGIGEPSAPDPLGASSVPALTQTPAVEAHIAYGFVFQVLPAVSGSKVNGSPSEVVAALTAALPSREPMVLGIYKRGFVGGHAITPLAIEDRGEGSVAILVYDNNFPNTIREVTVDTNANTWTYSGSTNPAESADKYEGDATTRTLEIEYAKNGVGVQPCSFCGSTSDASRKGLGGSDGPMAQLLWEGDSTDGSHSEFSVSDDAGNTSGCSGTGDDRECLNEIPGAELIPRKLGVDVWNESAPPVYELPLEGRYEIDFDARNVEGTVEEGFSLVREGVTFTVDDLELEDGDDQRVEVGPKDIAMVNRSDSDIDPTLEYGDVVGGTGYEVAVRANGLDDGSTLDLSTAPGKRSLSLELDAGESDDVRVTTVVKTIDESGDVDVAKTKPKTLDGGEDGTIPYGKKAFKDGKLELRR